MSRTVILHYHLFKNAGTSVDQILKQNFGDTWVTAEFPQQGGDNSDLVTEWIKTTPEAVAFSTHTAFGPVPQIDGVKIITVMMLRDPIKRIRSAYRFERTQEAQTWGSELAKTHDLEGYVRARLGRPGDRQCRNFQCQRLASMLPGPELELDRAMQAMSQLSVAGLVDDFDVALQDLADALAGDFPDFEWSSVQANRTNPAPESARDRVVNALLEQSNGDDLALIEAARSQRVRR